MLFYNDMSTFSVTLMELCTLYIYIFNFWQFQRREVIFQVYTNSRLSLTSTFAFFSALLTCASQSCLFPVPQNHRGQAFPYLGVLPKLFPLPKTLFPRTPSPVNWSSSFTCPFKSHRAEKSCLASYSTLVSSSPSF